MQKRPQLSMLRKIPDRFYEMQEHVRYKNVFHKLF